jgi:peptide/nickel transport system ATP-binding protein
VGESGCGKSTVARLICGLYAPTAGSILFAGTDLAKIAHRSDMLTMRRRFQMIFQDPYASLNPRWRVDGIVAEPILSHDLMKRGAALDKRVGELLTDVGLSPLDREKYPHEFSGGQRQRISIARALTSNPEFLVCDEPTSALDVSVQAAILNLLSELQLRSKTSYLLISHDLGVVRYLADRIAVMYLGRIMEVGDSETVFRGPNHPYTEALLSAVPNIDGEARARILLEGEIPSPADPPSGCVFNTRCHRAIAGLCEVTEPPLVEVEPGHQMACHIPIEELRTLQRRRTTEGAGDVEAAVAKAAETTGQSVEELAEAVQEAEAAEVEGPASDAGTPGSG